MTLKDLQMYRFLDHAINLAIRDINAISETKTTYVDSVSGSNPDYPYEQRNFKVVGENHTAEDERKRRLRSAEMELARLKRMKADIERLSKETQDARDRIIVENTLRGKTQTYIATLIGVDQSTVSRRLDEIIKNFSNDA